MKRTIAFIAVIALCQTLAFGQKKYKMVVETTDGNSVTFPTENIKRIYFLESNVSYSACPDGNHPHWIDLGLPSGTQWRCCNEGASAPEAYGDYYTFEHGQVSSAPTRDQIIEFLNNTTSVWTTQNGVNGRKFTGPNGGTIFLPAAGRRWGGEVEYVGSWGRYWSSTPYGEDHAYDLDFGPGGASCSYDSRNYYYSYYYDTVHSVRPVR